MSFYLLLDLEDKAIMAVAQVITNNEMQVIILHSKDKEWLGHKFISL